MNDSDVISIISNLQRPNVMQLLFTMKDAVDREVLDMALQRTIKRYPYFSFRLVKTENGIEKVENPLPIVVLDSVDEEITLGSGKVNYHWLALGCAGKEIRLVIHHGIADGRSALWFYKTLFYCYVTEKYGLAIDPGGINLPGSPVSPEENVKVLNPVEDADDSLRQMIDEPFLLPEPDDNPADYCFYKIDIPEKEFLSFGKGSDSSPVALFTILIAQALQRLYPENEKGIWSSVAIDARKALGCPFSRYNNAYVIFLKEDPSILEGDYEKLGVMTRGQIIVQSEECNLRAIHNIITGLSQKISQAGTEEERFGYFMEIYKNVAGNPTYILSYIGNPEWGGLEPYIERVYSIILPDRLAVEINSAGGKFCVCWMQTFTGDKYVRAFKAALDGINVDCELSGPYPYPFTKCEIQ